MLLLDEHHYFYFYFFNFIGDAKVLMFFYGEWPPLLILTVFQIIDLNL